MRAILAFVVFVAIFVCLDALRSGDTGQAAIAGVVLAGAAVLLWRNLRDPEKTRAAGLYCTVTFARAMPEKGTAVTVKTHDKSWDVVIDRAGETGDLTRQGTAHKGWVWLDAAGHPARVKIDYGSTWKTWDVLAKA